MYLKTEMRLCSKYASRAIWIFVLVELCILSMWWFLKLNWLIYPAGAVAFLVAGYLTRLETYFQVLKAIAAAQDEFQEYVDQKFEESRQAG